jgi:predicted nicotinamide N-methyase
MQQHTPSPRQSTADADAFVRQHTILTPVALVPELVLSLAAEPIGIFEAAESIGADQPYWAFAWPGGQALARWLLDNPVEIAGRRVLDLGTGSGLTAIAAMRAGAAAVIANDTDPLACAAARLNAAGNSEALHISQDDLLGDDPDAALILIGDLFYQPELATRVTAFLERASRRGADVLFADRTTSRRPALRFEQVAEYVAPLTPDMEVAYAESARVWRLG